MGDGSGKTGNAHGESRRSARSRSGKQGRAQTARRKTAEESVRWAARADRVIEFIEKLTVPSGIGQGEKFHLREWQKRFLRDIYEPVIRHKATHSPQGNLSVARKNGKRLIAALALVHLKPGSDRERRVTAANDANRPALL
jgi:phage terminase large subunit-like protein